MQGVEDSSNILIEFNPQQHLLYIHKILVYRGEKLIVDKLLASDLQVLRREYKAEYSILSGAATLSIILPDIKINDIIEMSYSIVDVNLLNVKFFNEFIQLEYSVPVYQLHFALITDNTIKFQYKFLDKKCEIQQRKYLDKEIYTLSLENLLPKKIEKYIPYWYRLVSLLQVGIEKSWNDIAMQVADFYKPVNIEAEALIDFIGEVKKDNCVTEEIILRALNFVFENIRYTANYKVTDYVKPTDPNITAKRLYGDCKDLTFLLLNILSHFEIKSYPVLVHTNYGKSLHEFLPAMNIFNHVILLIKLNQELYFIDATFRQDVDSLKRLYLPEYSYGLVCNKESAGLKEIKNSFPCSNQVSVLDEYEILSWEANKFILKTNIILEGRPALRLIQYIKSQSEQKLWESFHDFYSKFLIIEEVISNIINTSETSQNKISCMVQYRIAMRAIAKKRNNYICEIIPADLLEYFVYNLPEKVDADFYYGPLVGVEYKIIIFDKKIKFLNKKELIVSDDAFVISKTCERKKDKVIFAYYFDKIKEVVSCERYKPFYQNHMRSKELLRIGISRAAKIKIEARWFFNLIMIMSIIYFSSSRNKEHYVLPTTGSHIVQASNLSDSKLNDNSSNGNNGQNAGGLVDGPLTIDPKKQTELKIISTDNATWVMPKKQA